MADICERCGELEAVHTHHRKLRSRGGDDSPANLVRLCLPCHDWVHRNPAEATEQGWMVASWDDPETVGYQQTVDGEEVPHEEVVGEHNHDPELPPGQECPKCHRRIPYPKKKSSPQSKVFAYRVPVDDAETHEELLEAAARELGILEEPHWKWKLAAYGAAMILQGGRLTETGA